jgi:hypothetical protein
MPIPIPEALDESAQLALDKAEAAKNLPRYIVASLLAGSTSASPSSSSRASPGRSPAHTRPPRSSSREPSSASR